MRRLNKNSNIIENTLNAFSLLATKCTCSVCKCSCDCNSSKPASSQKSSGKSTGSGLGKAGKK